MKKILILMALTLLLGAYPQECINPTGSITIVIPPLPLEWDATQIYSEGDQCRLRNEFGVAQFWTSIQDENIGHKPYISLEWWRFDY